MTDNQFLPLPPAPNGKPYSGEVAPRQYFETSPGGQPEEDTGGLILYWKIIRRHKGTLLLAATLGAIAGVLIAFPQTPVYQAQVAIEIQSLNENFLNIKDLNQTSNGYNTDYDIQTQVRVLQSHVLLERVVKKMSTLDQAALIGGPNRVSAWRKALQLGEQKPPTVDDAVASANVNVKPSINSRIVEISCDAINPKVAAQFANTMAEEFIQQSLESRWDSTQKTGDWLTRQILDLKIKLEKSEDELQAYMNGAGLMFLGGEKDAKENVAEERLRQLQAELLKAESDRVLKQSHYEMAKSIPVDALPEVLDDQMLSEYQSKLTDLRRQMADLNFSLTPAHYKVQRLQAQIEAVESALKAARGSIMERVSNDYQTALNREKLLATDYATQKALVSEQAGKVVHYNILKREVDTNRQIYESMLQRVKESGIASAMKASGIRIVDPAVPPDFPYKPNIPRGAIMGLLGGLFVGAAFIFIRERSDRSLQQPGDTPFYLNVPELGVIPAAAADRARRSRKKKPTVVAGNVAVVKPELDCVELITWNRKLSLLSEAFHTTLTSVLFSGRNGSPRVLVLTSANPGEGKTTVATNLAIALAEINQRVLLIDADMRRPRLQEILELGMGPGLADLLADKNGLTLDKVVKPTDVPGLFALRSGRTNGTVSNLLHSARLIELLQQLRKTFDVVVIDTPPALHISDARVIGRLADAVIVVVRSGVTTRDSALMVKQRFHEDGTPLLGTILNDWNPKHDRYGYRYRDYGNGYYTPKETTVESGPAEP